MPLEEIAKRRAKFGVANLDRIELSENDFYNRVRNGYTDMSMMEKRFVTLDGTLSIEKIHTQIFDKVQDWIKNNE